MKVHYRRQRNIRQIRDELRKDARKRAEQVKEFELAFEPLTVVDDYKIRQRVNKEIPICKPNKGDIGLIIERINLAYKYAKQMKIMA